LKRQGNKSRQNFQRGSESGSRSLRTKQGGQRIRRFVAGAGGDDIVKGMMKFARSALDALEVVAKRSRDGLLNSIRFLCHTSFRRQFPRKITHLGIFGAS